MSYLELVWSQFGEDDAFLAALQASMTIAEHHLKAVKIVYDGGVMLGDSAAPWLQYLVDRVFDPQQWMIERVEFDFPFETRVEKQRIKRDEWWFVFRSCGSANEPFVHLMKRLDVMSEEGAEVTIHGVNMLDMHLIEIVEEPGEEAEADTSDKAEAEAETEEAEDKAETDTSDKVDTSDKAEAEAEPEPVDHEKVEKHRKTWYQYFFG